MAAAAEVWFAITIVTVRTDPPVVRVAEATDVPGEALVTLAVAQAVARAAVQVAEATVALGEAPAMSAVVQAAAVGEVTGTIPIEATALGEATADTTHLLTGLTKYHRPKQLPLMQHQPKQHQRQQLRRKLTFPRLARTHACNAIVQC